MVVAQEDGERATSIHKECMRVGPGRRGLAERGGDKLFMGHVRGLEDGAAELEAFREAAQLVVVTEVDAVVYGRREGG